MPRDKAAWIGKAWYSLELAASFGLFYLGLWLSSLLPEAGPLKWAITLALSFIAAIFLPSLLFGRPVLSLKWKIDGIAVDSGRPMVDLSHSRPSASEPEIAFHVDLTSSHNSLLAYLIFRNVVKRGHAVYVEATPPGVVAIKRQKGSPTATIQDVNGVESIRLALTDVGQESHSRLVGSFVPVLLSSDVDDLNLTARLFTADKSKRSYAAGVSCGIVGVKVRS